MIRLLIRADDIGYSDGVNCGILRAVRGGYVLSAGLMPNMLEAQNGFDMVKDLHVCIGQHTNLCAGRPCSDPAKIPSLLKEDGEFKTSSTFRKAFQEGHDLIDVDEAVIEIDAQYQRFKEITGMEPAYFEAHVIASDNLKQALEIVAERYHLLYSDMSPMQEYGTFHGKRIHQCAMHSMEKDYDPYASLKEAVENADGNVPNIFVCHPGYVDDYLLRHSSLTVNRIREVEMLYNKEKMAFLERKNIQLVSYRDIV